VLVFSRNVAVAVFGDADSASFFAWVLELELSTVGALECLSFGEDRIKQVEIGFAAPSVDVELVP
jgi:hypothetical protein